MARLANVELGPASLEAIGVLFEQHSGH